MYSETDLQSAVAAGALSHEAAEALRAHVAGQRTAPVADEEHFRLVTGFNDIFVTIAAILLLVACGAIGRAFAAGLGGLLVAGASWAMAEYFTRQRRMALPSIVLLLGFVGGLASGLGGTIAAALPGLSERQEALVGAGVALACAGAAWLHWRRFMVPITVAAGVGAGVVVVAALIVAALGPLASQGIVLPLVFVAGCAVFAYAMRWDTSDRRRETRRSDVAFWLHLLAAPMIAHPLFNWIGITAGHDIGAGAALGVLAIYVAMGLVALAVDRRALLVSALAYVLIALSWLLRQFGALELNVAITGLVIGTALLLLSAFWAPIRRALVGRLPAGLQARLPAAG